MTRLVMVVLIAVLTACSHSHEPQPTTAPPRQEPARADETGRGDGLSMLPPVVRPAYVVAIEPECVERELTSRKLNRYGDPEGTKYPGGAPPDLEAVTAESFDPAPPDEETRIEATRMMYVLHRHPEIETTCSAARSEADVGAGSTPTK